VTPKTLREALQRNRQRLAFERLTADAPWLAREVLDVVAADESATLDAEIRTVLARTRPEERGELVVSRSSDAFGRAVLAYFECRRESRFCTFLAHWQEAGGLVLDATYLGRHLSELLALDGDTVYGCNEGFGEVFAADRTVDDEGVTFEFFTVDLPAGGAAGFSPPKRSI
jgi:hypothetical protein